MNDNVAIIITIVVCVIFMLILDSIKRHLKKMCLKEVPKNSHKFFCNKDCQYFPCHDVKDPDELNCLFCYCPLYAHWDCNGNFTVIHADGKTIKDCSHCTIPHDPNGWSYIMKKLT